MHSSLGRRVKLHLKERKRERETERERRRKEGRKKGGKERKRKLARHGGLCLWSQLHRSYGDCIPVSHDSTAAL